GGAFGEGVQSSHSVSLFLDGAVNGSYYNPNFVNFNFSPYYNRSSANSTSQSITDASGFDFSSSIFGGSHFPGQVTFSRAFNSEGNFGVPGIADLSTHGDSQNFAVSWSELLPKMPSLNVGFSTGSNDYSVFGTDQMGNTHSHIFNARSAYQVDGFNLSGFYTNSNSNSTIPILLTDTIQSDKSSSSGDGYGFGVGHTIPLNGNVSFSYSHSDINSDYLGYHFD